MTDTRESSVITDHAFEPKGEWYTLCKHCNLSEAAHLTTTTPGVSGSVRDTAVRPGLPVADGNYCVQCGGMMVRTGTCETCTSCGHNTGCG